LLGCAVGDFWVWLRGLRSPAGVPGLPIAHSEIYLNNLYASVAEESPVPGTPFYHRITERYGQHIVAIEQVIRAVAIAPAMAAALLVRPKTPGLSILRRFKGLGGVTLEVTVNTHPADRFSYNIFLSRAETNEHA